MKIIQALEVGKCYHIYGNPRDRLMQSVWGRDRRLKKKKLYKEFWALRNVSFSLAKGTTLGIVGRNGSGKSTLLQIVAGTLRQTTGSVRIHGRVAALLELGSGFNPEFTGLENIFLNASVLGLSKIETERKLDQILGFADIGEFANQPVKTYSSGMVMRLAFAVQAHVEPEVLIVDEALAVGDELFQKKCYAHLSKLKESGTSILLVTHSVSQIMRHCDEALLLDQGEAITAGKPSRVVVAYQSLMNGRTISLAETQSSREEDSSQERDPKDVSNAEGLATHTDKALSLENGNAFFDHRLEPKSTEIYPVDGGEIVNTWIEDGTGRKVNTIPRGSEFTVVFSYSAYTDLKNVAMTCFIADHQGMGITGQTYPVSMGSVGGGVIPVINKSGQWTVRFSFNTGFWPGTYLISGALLDLSNGEKRFIHRVIDFRAFRIFEAADSTPVVPLGACNLASKDPRVKGLAD